jgi:DNA-binding NarL/FixJ family response regulator
VSTPIITVGIVEDQRETREGLAALIGGTPGYRVLGAWRSMEKALADDSVSAADVLLADIHLPGMSGIEGVRKLQDRHPGLQILMLTVYADNEHVFDAICAGACGYLLKDTPPARLLEAIREARSGGAPMSAEIARKVIERFKHLAPPVQESHNLSERERQVLRLLVEGQTYKTAADALSISIDTLRFHVRRVYEKLHVHSRSDAITKALRSGLVS